jgi:hypothetical protein
VPRGFRDIPVSCGGVATPGVDPIGKEPEIVHILGNVKIEQLERFVGVFSTAGAEARRGHGNRGAQLFRVAGEEDRGRAGDRPPRPAGGASVTWTSTPPRPTR